MSETSYQEYWASVEATAAEIAASGSDIGDAAHNYADSSWWVIYTHAAHAALMHSANEDAAFDMGVDALSGCESFSEVMTRLAFWAVYEDVRARAEELREEAEAEAEEGGAL